MAHDWLSVGLTVTALGTVAMTGYLKWTESPEARAAETRRVEQLRGLRVVKEFRDAKLCPEPTPGVFDCRELEGKR